MDLNEALMSSYGPALQEALTRDSWLLRAMDETERARRDALTPEERELEDLRNRVADLESRLEHARKALDDEDCGRGW